MFKKRIASGSSLALIFISLIWGLNWVVMKQSLQYAGPHDFNAMRMLLGTLVLFASMILKKKPLIPPCPLWTIALGICQTTLGTALLIMALEYGGAGKTSILVYTMPFWILLMAWLALGERLRGALWAPVILALWGLIFILEPWAMSGTLLSKSLAVLAGICWASGAVIVKFIGRNHNVDLVRLNAWQLLFGTIPLIAIALAIPSPPIDWSPFFIGSILYNAVLVCGVGLLLWFYVIDRLPAGIAGLGMLATPIIGMTSSRMYFGEGIDLWEGWGTALILVGLTILSFMKFRESKPLAPASGQDE